jgi:hypothetical protein
VSRGELHRLTCGCNEGACLYRARCGIVRHRRRPNPRLPHSTPSAYSRRGPQGEQGHTRAKGGGRQHSDAAAIPACPVAVAAAQLSEFDVANPSAQSTSDAALWAGVALMAGGFVGMITSGAVLRARKRKLRQQEADAGRPRRVMAGKPPSHRKGRRAKWDSGTSRLVF